MKPIRVGIAGLGVVGSGVVRQLKEQAAEIAERVGAPVQVVAAADRSANTAKLVGKKVYTQDAFAVARNPEVDIFVEVIGGVTVAYDLMHEAVQRGKYVVTANKACLAERGGELFRSAQEAGTGILFEAAVAGAIPILRTLRTSMAGDRIEMLYGILNGTCNYILTRLSEEGGSFAEVLADAQRLGYAEADPTLDVGGGDTAHKIALLALLAYGAEVPFKDISVQGITELTAADFAIARKIGRTIKLTAVAKRVGEYLDIRVHPALLPDDMPLAKIRGSMNAVAVSAAYAGDVLLAGRGAGSLPTASAVVADILEAAKALRGAGLTAPQTGHPVTHPAQVLPLSKTESGMYLRFTVKDEPGIIYSISRVLAKYKLSIRDIIQLDLHEFKKTVPLACTLHPAPAATVAKAVAELDKLSCMGAKTAVLRMEG